MEQVRRTPNALSVLCIVVVALVVSSQLSWANDTVSIKTNQTVSIRASCPKNDGRGGWYPSVINVRQGEKVTIKITSVDLSHQFLIPELGVTAPVVSPGQTVTVSFVASRAGTFPILCGAVCGPTHGLMRGKLVVKP